MAKTAWGELAPRGQLLAAPGPYPSHLVHNIRGRWRSLLLGNADSLEPLLEEKERCRPASKYVFSSQENLTVFKADRKGISMMVYNASGQVIDRINNLMTVREKGH